MKTKKILYYPLQILKQVVYLPKTVTKQDSISDRLNTVNIELDKLSSIIDVNSNKIEDVKNLVHTLDEHIVNIKHTISTSKKNVGSEEKNTSINNTVADNHNLDYFYKLFEDRFRGTENDIKIRVSEYKPLFDSLDENVKKMPIIDLGCGRGEFLSFAKDNGLSAIGVDMNHDMVVRSKKLGFNVYETDAMSYLLDQKTKSIGVITGFHIVEHIPFDLLIKLFEECYRVLSSDGFVLFETPNPKNLTISSNNFYIDPSHTKPLPPELLSFALESVGFKTEIIFKHPIREKIEHNDKEVELIMKMIYGPQDYSVLAKKL